jgi:hypothetical protein
VVGGGAGRRRCPGIFQWRPFVGPFHSILLHFPIGFVTMAFLVDPYYLWRPKAMNAKPTEPEK